MIVVNVLPPELLVCVDTDEEIVTVLPVLVGRVVSVWLAIVLCVDWDDPGTVVRLPLVVNDGADEVALVL